MDAKEAAKVLRRHNEWRRGADNNHWQKPPYSQAELGHAIDAAVAALEWLEKLKDPGVVLVNMMRGHIANPHAETAARCDALAAENDRMRERLEGMAKHVEIVFHIYDAETESLLGSATVRPEATMTFHAYARPAEASKGGAE